MPGSEANPAEVGSPAADGADDPPVPPPAAQDGASRDVYKSPIRDETAINPLLARAHLLRIRRQWDEAVAVCTEALRRVPESATACSLLGDIYEAQGKLDIAMHWFGMAVEMDSGNKADRAKLDRVVGIQRRALLAEERDAQARVAAAGGSSPHRTLQWFDRVFPPGRQETLARLILLIGGSLFLLLACTAAFVYFGGRTPESGVPLAPPIPQGPVVVQPPDEPSSVQPAPRESGIPTAPPSPIAPTPSATTSSQDALRTAVARSVPAEVLVTGVQADPQASQLGLTIALPEMAEAASRTRARVLRAAVQAGRAAALELPQMDRAAIRVSLRGGNAGAPVAQLVFVGDTATTALRVLDPARAPDSDLRALFTNAWWSPPLDPANNP